MTLASWQVMREVEAFIGMLWILVGVYAGLGLVLAVLTVIAEVVDGTP